MTLAQRFQQKRQAILTDKNLSEHGRQAKLRELFAEAETEIAAERVRLQATEAGLQQRRTEILKQKPPMSKLPAVPIKSGDSAYLSDFEKSQLGMFATIAGLLGEQRAGKRLVAAVAAAETPEKARQAIEREMNLLPFAGQAFLLAFSELLAAAEAKFSGQVRQAQTEDGLSVMAGDNIALNQLKVYLSSQYQTALAEDQTPEQLRFFAENAQSLDDISASTIKNVQASIGLEATWGDIQSLTTDARLKSFTAED